MATLQECCEQLRDGVLNYNPNQVAEAAKEVAAQGYNAQAAVFDGLLAGMRLVGEHYEHGYFVPEVLLCTEALSAGLDILKPHLSKHDLGVKGQVVMGAVQDDDVYENAVQFECTNCSLVPNLEYDASKNVIKGLFEVAGFQVHDLGRNVSLNAFVANHLKTDSGILCLLAVMPNTTNGIDEMIRKIKEKNSKCRIVIGGTPVTKGISGKWGVDGYSFNTDNTLRATMRMLDILKDLYDTRLS